MQWWKVTKYRWDSWKLHSLLNFLLRFTENSVFFTLSSLFVMLIFQEFAPFTLTENHTHSLKIAWKYIEVHLKYTDISLLCQRQTCEAFKCLIGKWRCWCHIDGQSSKPPICKFDLALLHMISLSARYSRPSICQKGHVSDTKTSYLHPADIAEN